MMNSVKFDVVLLAAGRGVRLGDLTNESPKCLLPISGEKTILDIYLDYFIPQPQIRRVCIIGGYAFSNLADHVVSYWPSTLEFGKIVLLMNPVFNTTNNIVTFIQSAPFFNTGGILIEADLVCSPDIYGRVISHAQDQPETSILVIDESRKDRPDAMRISKHENGMINQIGKSIELSISSGEFLGISYLSARDAANAVGICKNLVSQGEKHLFYEEGFATGSSKGDLPLYPMPTDKSTWSEVDDEMDYANAKQLFASFEK